MIHDQICRLRESVLCFTRLIPIPNMQTEAYSNFRKFNDKRFTLHAPAQF